MFEDAFLRGGITTILLLAVAMCYGAGYIILENVKTKWKHVIAPFIIPFMVVVFAGFIILLGMLIGLVI